MDLLFKPPSSFGFDDIVAFCQEGHREGWQLDYKQLMPAKGLSKLFAAFSNTRGGVIIIGVEEDKIKGVPVKWEGVANDVKLVEKIHQSATNVEPLPHYDVHVTDEKNGKVFILVRIFEGDQTPYYVHNDANIWVRTGDISNPVSLASPEAAELLFGKREKAHLARLNYAKRTKEVYVAALARSDRERERLIAEERDKQKRFQQKVGVDNPYQSQYTSQKMGTSVSMFKILLQPHYPHRALAKPEDIKNKLPDLRIRGYHFGDFPTLELEAIPDGVMMFEANYGDGSIRTGQFFANGTIYRADDVVRFNQETKEMTVMLYWLGAAFYQTLLFAQKYYQFLGYQGTIEGEISIDDVQGHTVRTIHTQKFGSDFFERYHASLLPSHQWPISLDTATLNRDDLLPRVFNEKMNEIYWSFGYPNLHPKIAIDFLRENGFLTEEQAQALA